MIGATHHTVFIGELVMPSLLVHQLKRGYVKSRVKLYGLGSSLKVPDAPALNCFLFELGCEY